MPKLAITPEGNAMAVALANEGVNYPDERGERMVKRLRALGFAVTNLSNWDNRPAQTVNTIVQDDAASKCSAPNPTPGHPG